MRPLIRRREGLPWLIGNDSVEVAGIAVAPTPPVSPTSVSEPPDTPGGEVSPSCGVTLQNTFILTKPGNITLGFFFHYACYLQNVQGLYCKDGLKR